MTNTWTFYSLSANRLDELFGGADPEQERELIAVLLDRNQFEFEDSELPRKVAHRALREGLHSASLDEDELEIADCLLLAALGSDELTAFLEAEPESTDGLDLRAAAELIDRAGRDIDLKLLTILAEGGRRLGDKDADFCEYLVFSPDELPILLQEARAAAAVPLSWTHERLRENAERELIHVLERAIYDRKALAGFFL